MSETPIRFDGGRAKILHERLDAVLTTTSNGEDLVEALTTITSWRGTPDLWKTVDHWLREHSAKEA